MAGTPWHKIKQDAHLGPPSHDVFVEVAIVGAGLTGLATALLLREKGYKVAIFERSAVGAGVTGQTTGKLTALQGFTNEQINRRHGPEITSRYTSGTVSAIDWLVDLIEKEKIDCSLEQRQAVSLATATADQDKVEGELIASQRAGLDVEFSASIDSLPMPMVAAVSLDGQYQLDGLALVTSLAQLAIERGVDIYQNTTVVAAESRDHRCLLKLANGREVNCEQAILASHTPSPDVHLLSLSYGVSRSAAVAVKRAPGQDSIPMAYLSGSGPVVSLRDFGDMIIAVGAHHAVGSDGDKDKFDRLANQTMMWFPGKVGYRWSAQDSKEDGLLPLVGAASPREERIFIATGYNKWGLSSSAAAAHCLVGYIERKTSHPWQQMADPWAPFRWRDVKAGQTFLARQAGIASHFVGGRMKTRHWGEAAISGPPWRRVATFTDNKGERHSFSAECTHLGCELRWNGYEQSWDCPCHGSRFDARSGEILEGPATYPLKRQF